MNSENRFQPTPVQQFGLEEVENNLITLTEPDEEVADFREISVDVKEAADSMSHSIDFLAAVCVPSVYKYHFPPIYLALWDWLKEYINKQRDFSQLCLGLPRGFGKTLLMKLFICFVIFFTTRKFILIMASKQEKANNILADVTDILDEPNIQAIFGNWRTGLEIDRQNLKKFGFRGRNIILMAAGADSDVRGITLKNERPDVMLFDDIQSRQCAESQTESETLERELIGTIMKAKSPHGCMFLFVGNMYPTKYSILRKLKYNPNWVKFIVGGILQDGTSLWEDLQPVAQLKKELANDIAMGRPEIFFSEVLNDENAASNNILDLSKIEYKYDNEEIAAGKFIVIDPATGKLNSDAVAIGYFEIIDSKPCMRRVTSERMNPAQNIRIAITWALETQTKLICIESVAYQATLKFWAEFICQQMGVIGLEFVEIYPGTRSKNSRILGALRSYGAGDILVHPDCRPTVHLQVTQFNPLKTDNVDDVLDLIAYAPKVVELFGDYIVNTGDLSPVDFPKNVLSDNCVY